MPKKPDETAATADAPVTMPDPTAPPAPDRPHTPQIHGLQGQVASGEWITILSFDHALNDAEGKAVFRFTGAQLAADLARLAEAGAPPQHVYGVDIVLRRFVAFRGAVAQG